MAANLSSSLVVTQFCVAIAAGIAFCFITYYNFDFYFRRKVKSRTSVGFELFFNTTI